MTNITNLKIGNFLNPTYKKNLIEKIKVDKQGIFLAYLLFVEIFSLFMKIGGYNE